MGRGRGNKRDTVSVPKLTPGTSTTKSSAARGRGKGRPPLVTGPQRRQILVEVNRGHNHDEADNEVDSEKENNKKPVRLYAELFSVRYSVDIWWFFVLNDVFCFFVLLLFLTSLRYANPLFF